MERLDNVDELIWGQTFAEQRRLLGSQYFSAISTPSLLCCEEGYATMIVTIDTVHFLFVEMTILACIKS